MTGLFELFRARRRWLARFLPGLALPLVLSGCQSRPARLPLEARYQPSNIYSKGPMLDPEVKRVALLPMAPLLPTETFQAGVDSLQPLLRAELEKAKRFEVIVVTPEQLRRWTGQGVWKSEDQLPPDFFDRLQEETGCHAVFFNQLTRYQPYQPVAVGWKLTLVFNKDHVIYWQANEVFDAGDGAVANAARAYEAEHITTQSPLPDPNAILSSPSRFGQYTLHALLTTLPRR
ncbi:MAG: hypothetical protein ABSH38_15140 [Verrucomicrobiota bacterium]